MRAPSRYSRFVRVMRLVLPLGAVGLLALVVLWPRLQGLDGGFVVPAADEVALERDGRVRLDHPRYVGEAREGRAYVVEADAARVDPTAPRRIELERMRASLPTEGERDVAVAAAHAVYDRDRAWIDLDGGIEVATSDGYRLETEAAVVALEAGRLETRSPVDGTGPEGAIRADRLVVESDGRVIRFEGNVRVTLALPRRPVETGS